MDGPGHQLVALEEQSGNDRSRSWFALATGLNLAITVCYLTCKPPQTHALSWPERLLTSAIYLLVASLIGALGTWSCFPAALEDTSGHWHSAESAAGSSFPPLSCFSNTNLSGPH